MPVPEAPRGVPSEQITDILPLADSLYDSTSREPTLVNQARNELSLLRLVLDATRTSLALLCVDYPVVAIDNALAGCRVALLELEELHRQADEVGPVNPLSDIRGRFSSLIFELSVMNADMMISSQANVNQLLRGYIEDVRAGKRESAVVSNVLDDASPKSEKDEAWNKLQNELHDVGIIPEWSDQDHGYIISTLRYAVDREHLLERCGQNAVTSARSSWSKKPALPPRNSLYNTTPSGDPLTLPIRSQEDSEKGLSDKEVLPTEDFPIPVAMELQDTDDTQKQALPIDDFPIPMAMEPFFPTNNDTDKQAVPRETLPIPVQSETSVENSQENRSVNSYSMNSSSRPKSIIRGKKPSIMKRMKFKLTGSKEDFVTLIQMGGLYSVKVSLDKGADVDTTNDAGETALMVAVSFGHKDIVELLLQYGADIERRSDNGDTALGAAALRGREDIVRIFLENGANPDAGKNLGKTALSQAAAAGHEGIVRLFLDRGADPNVLCTSGDTALSRAAFYGNVEIARLLLTTGAEVDKTAYPRKTPLWKAVHQGKTDMVSLLMEFLADPLKKDVHGQSPLSMASSLGRSEIIRIFERYGYQATPFQYY
ncbi:uncharacterized protein N7458_008355 [Penicillium daleae]|uniref:Ankyrin repeat protein n=1 Tax=Penicillium daleae TaxID=63821 RepID=A0AAD6C2J2_9EURO|nr:uncharacterized protein N7458_008355 [Penicillium daleae]KAJ5444483.1 hypothetical protein N7458_008355 [Penicillium daleae]